MRFGHEEDASLLLLSWVGAVTLSGLVVVGAYAQGQSLLVGGDAEAMADLGTRLLAGGSLFPGDLLCYLPTFFRSRADS